MASYTMSQMEDLWKKAGGSATTAPFAAAVGMAESGGNSAALNSNSNGSVDRGLWQINSIHGGLSTTDPIANARAAVQISHNGTNWRPWCVAWSDGKCGGTFLGTGAPVFRFFNGTSGASGGTSSVDTTGGVTATNAGFENPLNPSTWANAFLKPLFVSSFYAGLGMVGVALMVLGVVILVNESKTADLVRQLGGRAAKAIPQTAVAGAAVDAKNQKKQQKQQEQQQKESEA